MSRVGLLLWFVFLAPFSLQAQIDDAKAAIDRGEYVRAINILVKEVAERPSADAYIYLGFSYAHIREFDKAEAIFNEGAGRFPNDPRFHNERADAYLAANDVEQARVALAQALRVDPANAYASDLLANIDMSEGEVQTALRAWNKSGRPIIDDVLNNGYLSRSHWTIDKATAFHPGGVLRYAEWRTTERRLFETGFFSNVGVEVEPDPLPDHYDANLLTSLNTNAFGSFIFNAIKGVPFDSTYIDLWNLRDSGPSLHSMYRWDTHRRRGEFGIRAPLPLPGLLFLDAAGIWRSEEWDLQGQNVRFKSTGGRVTLKYIPHYRFEAGAGFEYRNRGGADNRNFGRVIGEVTVRLADDRYRNRLHADGFTTREYRMGALELNNRYTLSKASATILDWTLKGGTSRGTVPFEDKFLLGADIETRNLLRGHAIAYQGRYGRSPMGTDFGLVNVDIERRIAILPLFNTVNIPYLSVKGEVFVDAAKTNESHKILVDVGAGLKFESPTYGLNLIYGRSLRDGQDVFAAYIEKRWW